VVVLPKILWWFLTVNRSGLCIGRIGHSLLVCYFYLLLNLLVNLLLLLLWFMVSWLLHDVVGLFRRYFKVIMRGGLDRRLQHLLIHFLIRLSSMWQLWCRNKFELHIFSAIASQVLLGDILLQQLSWFWWWSLLTRQLAVDFHFLIIALFILLGEIMIRLFLYITHLSPFGTNLPN